MSIIVECPHCKMNILIYEKEIKCGIFRHGVYMKTYKQIDSHLPQSECEHLVKKKLIYGCGKPFKLVEHDSAYHAVICDYI